MLENGSMSARLHGVVMRHRGIAYCLIVGWYVWSVPLLVVSSILCLPMMVVSTLAAGRTGRVRVIEFLERFV